MLLEKYDFTCRLESDAQLPYYKGSTFRGVFGRALKKVICALKQQECSSCLLNTQCLYVKIFETNILANSKNSRMSSTPQPFVIEPPLTARTRFPSGSCFDFSLILMGRTNDFISYFIYAFEQMGKIGIGKKTGGQRGKFLLEKVQWNGKKIYSSSDRKLMLARSGEKFNTNFFQGASQKQLFRLHLTLETPLRLKFANRLQADLPFHLLVRAMLRRISSLMNAYGEGEPAFDYPDLVKRAQTVKTAEKNLSWYDWQRYSFRQDQKMLMGGMTGNIIYDGIPGEYMPLIEFCEQAHIGKQTTFGLGKIKAQIIS